MKTFLVLIMVCLVLCEGRIPEYRRSKSKRDRDFEEESYEEDYGDLSFEEPEEDSAPRYDRRLRASVYQPSYGYSKSYKRKYDSEDGVKLRKPKYSEERSRGYAKGPHKTFKKDIVSKQQSFTPEVRDRKKDHRSAPMYEPMYHYPSPPPPSYSLPPPSVPYHKPVPPKVQCSEQLMISCTPTVTKVPCSADFGEHHPSPQHMPESPYYEAPAYHAPEPAYSPPAPQYLPPSKPTYHHHSVQPEPVHRPLYHKPGQHPYYHSKPESGPAPPAYHQPYQPTYKSNSQTPSFAAPVSEDNDEPAVRPVISAFRTTTTTTTQRVPTVPADRDQNFQNAENHNQRSQNGGEEAQNPKEASGDDPEPSMVATHGTTSSTTPEPQPSSTPSEDDNAQR